MGGCTPRTRKTWWGNVSVPLAAYGTFVSRSMLTMQGDDKCVVELYSSHAGGVWSVFSAEIGAQLFRVITIGRTTVYLARAL